MIETRLQEACLPQPSFCAPLTMAGAIPHLGLMLGDPSHRVYRQQPGDPHISLIPTSALFFLPQNEKTINQKSGPKTPIFNKVTQETRVWAENERWTFH